MNLLNKGDFLESYTKIKQKGIGFFLKKLNPIPRKRTQSTFAPEPDDGANWWIIPEVQARENIRISGKADTTFDVYLADKYLKTKRGLNLLSVGCGSGAREIRMAQSGIFDEVLGIDLSSGLIDEANREVMAEKLTNAKFIQADFYQYELRPAHYDIVLFHSSMHHFKNIDLISKRIHKALKNNGYLVINEYVGKNRLQFSREQTAEMNRLLALIPPHLKTRYLTGLPKEKVFAPGLLRMIASDPSEAVESETIIPALHRNFKIVEEKKIGGDLLMMVLKDIAHHFVDGSPEAREILAKLFEEEDKYLIFNTKADFIFGVYQKSETND